MVVDVKKNERILISVTIPLQNYNLISRCSRLCDIIMTFCRYSMRKKERLGDDVADVVISSNLFTILPFHPSSVRYNDVGDVVSQALLLIGLTYRSAKRR